MMDSDSDSSAEFEKDSSDVENIDKSTTCAYCSGNFEGVNRDNRPVMNPCVCIFHWYCRYKNSRYSKDSDCVSCPRCGKLTLKIAKLKSTVNAVNAQQETIDKLSKQSSE